MLYSSVAVAKILSAHWRSTAQGTAYVIGRTRSTDLPTVNPIQAAHSGGDAYDGFLAVFHPVTLQPVFATYLGGTGVEFLNGITGGQDHKLRFGVF